MIVKTHLPVRLITGFHELSENGKEGDPADGYRRGRAVALNSCRPTPPIARSLPSTPPPPTPHGPGFPGQVTGAFRTGENPVPSRAGRGGKTGGAVRALLVRYFSSRRLPGGRGQGQPAPGSKGRERFSKASSRDGFGKRPSSEKGQSFLREIPKNVGRGTECVCQKHTKGQRAEPPERGPHNAE